MENLCIECQQEPRLPKRRLGRICHRQKQVDHQILYKIRKRNKARSTALANYFPWRAFITGKGDHAFSYIKPSHWQIEYRRLVG